MSNIPTYVPLIPLPAAVTTGGTQFYTDPNGDVWVANPSVSGGIWQRARSVLYCRVYRAAAYTTPASNSLFVFDTAASDAYGMMGGGVINLPIPGSWLAGASVEIGATTAGDSNAFYLNMAGAGFRSTYVLTTNAAYTLLRTGISMVCPILSVPANVSIQTEYMTAGRGVIAQDGRTFLWAKYMGA
jgi:hypothetical protein